MNRQRDPAAVVNPAAGHVEVEETPEASDAVLVARAAGGDDEAFALLYHRHKHDTWRLASFTLRDAHEAEDVVQETFLRAYRSLAGFHGGPSARAWLLTICRNLCLDRLRRRTARGLAFLEDAPGLDPPAPAADVDTRLDLRRALAGLAVEDVEAFFFVDVLGLRSHEAAAVLDLAAPSTLRSRLTRARAQLAQALAPPPAAVGREVWGVLHTPPDRAIVVAHGAEAGAVPADVAPPAHPGALVRFFEALEHRIPAGRRVLAVLGAPPRVSVAAAAPWIAHHPRWRLRLSSGDRWRRDAERLLTDGDDPAALARLRSSEPFVWTPGP
ncbi:MAG: sigma-70 family RNA polymerase sigma factor [Solirubrobacteraceae bacterium]|nr:sigma-70 family RNA polymerase sigma factor [Solirubrobacteraceae bacterium]